MDAYHWNEGSGCNRCIRLCIFGVGVEVAGITVSKIIVKWFKGKELALAMGLEMASARVGTGLHSLHLILLQFG